MCSLLFPFRRLVLFAQKGAPRSPAERASGAAALELLAAGRLLCERRGVLLLQVSPFSSPNVEKWTAEGGEAPGGCYFSPRVLFQLGFCQVTV